LFLVLDSPGYFKSCKEVIKDLDDPVMKA